MTWQRWDDDDELLAELGQALREPGPIAEQFVTAGEGAFAWRTVEEDLALAALAYDSLLDDELAVRARSQSPPRALVFEAPGLAVEVQVSGEGVVGQLTPAGVGEVSLLTPDGPAARADADDIGCFVFGPPPPGPVRLECRTSDAALVTDWVCL
jgi:hypothetical protein